MADDPRPGRTSPFAGYLTLVVVLMLMAATAVGLATCAGLAW